MTWQQIEGFYMRHRDNDLTYSDGYIMNEQEQELGRYGHFVNYL